MPHHIVIIGNGITGTTAARMVRKAGDHAITMISDETEHPYARTALMYIYMGHLRYRDTKLYEDGFWEKNRIHLVHGRVVRIDPEGKTVQLHDGRKIPYDRLLIATGSVPHFAGWPGEHLEGVQGLYGMPDLDRMERDTRRVRRAVVVGGGLIGVEMVEMLHTRGIPVTFLVRGKRYMSLVLPAEESALVATEIRRHDIDLRLGTGLREILGDDLGRVRGVVTSEGEEIACEFVGITAGVTPNLGALEGSGIETGRGVLVNRYFETSAPDVFAAGDCAEFREEEAGHRPVEQLWYSGRRQGQAAARNLLGEHAPYDRGLFFNSAKFFTLEWQQYGTILPEPTAGFETFLWQDTKQRKLVRLDYREDDGAIVGVNVMGTRFRQEVCEGWIASRTPVAQVIARLCEAAFDPELHRHFAREVSRSYRERRASSVSL